LKKLIVVLVILASGVAFSGIAAAGGLEASFTGSRLPNARSSMIFQYRGDTIDSAGNLIDVSGENLFQDSNCGAWTAPRGSFSVNSVKNPLDGNLTAGIYSEDNSPATDHGFYPSGYAATVGHTYTMSIYLYPVNRQWVRIGFYEATGAYYDYFFNLSTGTLGTVDAAAGGIGYSYQRIVGNWWRLSITRVAQATENIFLIVHPAEADNDYTFDGLSQPDFNYYGAQVVDNTDGYIVGPGLYHATTATTKPRLDLAPTGNPPGIDSHLQDSAGNKLRARSFDGATQYYSRAHHDAMNINDTDHTYTFVVRPTSNTSSPTLFTHGAVISTGCYFYWSAGGTGFQATYSSGAGFVGTNLIAFVLNQYHIIQIVRSSNSATVYMDGSPTAPLDVTGYGIDVNATMYLGTYNAVPTNPAFADILYTSLDSRALSVIELAKDREEINGYLSGPKQVNPAWTFTRTTAAKQTYSTGGIRDRAINIPRVGDGVLIEGQRSNYCQQSETPAAWAPTRASVTNTTSTTLPNGTASGFHVLHEDATAANTHYINAGNIVAAPPGIFTFSADVKAINRQWIALYMYDSTPTNMYATFNVSTGVVGADSGGIISKKMEPIGNGWWRCSFTATMAGNDVSYLLIVAEGSGDFTFNGLDQDSLFVTNMQGENNSFATSYCGPTLASYLTCTKDNLTIDPHTASTNQYILPTIFFPGGPSKLTIEFDAKCEFSSSVDASQMLFLSIGDAGATNYINIFTLTNGKVYFATNASSSSHDIYSAANPVVFSNLNHYKFFLDFADMSRSEAWINGSNAGMTYVNHTGTAVLYTSTIRIGQDHDTYQVSGMQIKNLRILPVEF
jgi:hypothetical protein